MRYMRWSYFDLATCPDDYIDIVIEEIKRDHDAAVERARKARNR